MYWCKMGDITGSIYYLHIDSNFKEVDIADIRNYPSQTISTESVSRYDLKIYTTWTPWSSCSTCDAVGIKLRYGYCTISFLGSSLHGHFNANVLTKNELQKTRYVKNTGK